MRLKSVLEQFCVNPTQAVIDDFDENLVDFLTSETTVNLMKEIRFKEPKAVILISIEKGLGMHWMLGELLSRHLKWIHYMNENEYLLN